MVKVMKFKKRLGGANRYKRRFTKKFSRFKRKKYSGYKPSYSRFGKFKSYNYRGRQHKRLATSLFIQKAIASTVLSSLHANVTEFFVNTYTFSSDEVRVPDNYVQPVEHVKSISSLNPVRLFTKTNKDLGIDSHTVNPLIKVKNTKLHFIGHDSSLVNILSLYSPLNLSYDSCMNLHKLIGMTYSQLDNFVIMCLNACPAFVFEIDDVGARIQYDAGSLYDLVTDPMRFGNAVTRELVTSVFLSIVMRFLRSVVLRASYKPIVQGVHFINVTARTIDFNVSEFTNEEMEDNTAFWDNKVVPIANNYFNTWNGYVVNAANPLPNPIYNASAIVRNPYLYSFVCLSAVDKDSTNAFVSFVADIINLSYRKKNEVRSPENSILSAYLAEVQSRRATANVDYANLDYLVKNKIIKIKMVSAKKSIIYNPKSQTNAHWVTVPAGSSLKISTEFSRDYSGFMALFKSSVRNSILRSELTDDGLALFRKLEPTYNLYN